MELFGAAYQLVAIHLGHDQIAEKKVNGTGESLLDDLQRLLSVRRGNDTVASGFEKKGADREYLFVVVYAEDRLLRPHAFLSSAERHLGVTCGRWAGPTNLLVCRRSGPVVIENSPAIQLDRYSGT